jgi:hypothetical protein
MTVLNRDRPVTDEELLAARTEPCFVASLCYHKEGEETAYSLQLIPQSGDWTAIVCKSLEDLRRVVFRMKRLDVLPMIEDHTGQGVLTELGLTYEADVNWSDFDNPIYKGLADRIGQLLPDMPFGTLLAFPSESLADARVVVFVNLKRDKRHGEKVYERFIGLLATTEDAPERVFADRSADRETLIIGMDIDFLDDKDAAGTALTIDEALWKCECFDLSDCWVTGNSDLFRHEKYNGNLKAIQHAIPRLIPGCEVIMPMPTMPYIIDIHVGAAK